MSYTRDRAVCAALVIAVIALVACCAGCGRDPRVKLEVQSNAYVLPGGAVAYEFGLLDGTRCVAVPNDGVTCDWKQPVEIRVTPRVE